MKKMFFLTLEYLVGILFFAYSIFSYFDYKFEITPFAKVGTDVIQPLFLFVPVGIFGIVCCVIDYVKEIKKIKALKEVTQNKEKKK